MDNNIINSLLNMGGNTQQQTQPQIDKLQLKLAMRNMNNQTLMQLVQQARSKGISDTEIEEGLNFLLKM